MYEQDSSSLSSGGKEEGLQDHSSGYVILVTVLFLTGTILKENDSILYITLVDSLSNLIQASLARKLTCVTASG
jgi:hypothetical protein